MAIDVTCPKCRYSLSSATGQTLPSHCPACGVRLTCPHCGSPLERHDDPEEPFFCSKCQTGLLGDDTEPFGKVSLSSRPFVPELPGLELREELGRGGMGIVYRAWQARLQREVAVKVLPPFLAASVEHLERFRKEAALAGGLVDSHILPVFDIQEVQGVPVIVMPLVKGKDLGRILRDRKLVKQGRPTEQPHPWATLDDQAYLNQILPLLDQIIRAVTALHRSGVLHRDIKPSNVLVDDNANVWISDFGLARLEEQGMGTRPGQELGTPGFISPEQARGQEEIDFRADLFSLGATIYKALTLELPYGRNVPTTPDAASPAPLSQKQPLVSPEFDQVILKSLELDRNQRHASAQEFQTDWQRAREGRRPRKDRRNAVAEIVHRHPFQVAACLAAVVLLILVGASFWSRDSSARPDSSPVPPAQTPEKVVTRTIRLITHPPGARVVLVPIHPLDGSYQEKKALRPKEKTPVTIPDVPTGEYLIVAEVTGHGFHEVFRTVPRPGQIMIEQRIHQSWEDKPDGSAELSDITIPGADVIRSMTFFEGKVFTLGSKDVQDSPPHLHKVLDFYLDTTEVTVAEYRRIKKGLPPSMKVEMPPPDFAVTFVSFDQAMDYAERAGKRLPDEAEYEFAATSGGKFRYPWGNEDRIQKWPIGKVKEPEFDKTATDPPVYGLFSNVAEWTTSWNVPYPTADPVIVKNFFTPEIQRLYFDSRIVRGGPYDVVENKVPPLGPDKSWIWDPRHRHGITRDRCYPGLGFRCARSAKPRFLNPE